MKPEQFCYWLQGRFETADGVLPVLTKQDIQMINDHLQLVFKKVTPEYDPLVINPTSEIPMFTKEDAEKIKKAVGKPKSRLCRSPLDTTVFIC